MRPTRNRAPWARTVQHGVVWLAVLACAGCGLRVVTLVSPAPPMSHAQDGGLSPSPEPGTTKAAPPKPHPHAPPPAPSPDEPPRAQTPPGPKPSPLVISQAESQLNAGQFDEVIALLEPVLRTAPDDPDSIRLLRDAYNRRALARYGADRIEDAVADMARSLEIDPAQPDLRARLSLARERLDRLKSLR
ncbi:MAG: tetratricopeptide repeat protein [Nitrospirae bacterium]|nr:tetratricopeptide repeat protein [Nitrospirota bacterium]